MTWFIRTKKSINNEHPLYVRMCTNGLPLLMAHSTITHLINTSTIHKPAEYVDQTAAQAAIDAIGLPYSDVLEPIEQ